MKLIELNLKNIGKVLINFDLISGIIEKYDNGVFVHTDIFCC